MENQLVPAAWAVAGSGFIAAIAMLTAAALIQRLGRSVAMTTLVGCLVLPDPRRPATETAGFLIVLVVGSTLAAWVYLWLLKLIPLPYWQAGLLLGTLNGILIAAAFPIFGTISACVGDRALPPPGPFGSAWGLLTPIAVVIGHLVYGGAFGGILSSLSPIEEEVTVSVVIGQEIVSRSGTFFESGAALVWGLH